MPAPSRRPRPQSSHTGYYVASTHWDREWYEAFQHYRFRLVDVLDGALELLERDPEFRSYHLDGQTVLLEDYLEIRPERRPRLKALFDAGRLEAGPWYTLPDEFLNSGESLVRNLLRGHQVAAEFGPPLKVGFVSDIFGHNSQLPQILRGFGIDCAVVWRGTNEATHPGLFRWQGADGSEVLAYTCEDRGYGQYQFEVRWPARRPDGSFDYAAGVAGLKKVIAYEARRVPGRTLLLFDGFDHIDVEPATSRLFARARRAGLNIVHGPLRGFFDAVRRQKLRLKRFRGELRDPALREGHVIPGVLSSRIYLKQANAHCENLLLRWAEPLAALAGLLGSAPPSAYLRLAWKYLLQNHAHDSICGCSIDQVHQDMQHRFDQCRLIAERVRDLSARAIADRTPLPQLEGPEDFILTVFNPCSTAIDGVVDLPLHFPRDTQLRFQDWFGYEPVIGLRLYDPAGREIEYQRLDVTKVEPVRTYDPRAGFSGDKYEQVRVAARLRIPGHGWTTLVCRPTKDYTRSGGTQLCDDRTMQNEFLRVRVNPNGTLELTDRRARRTYRDLLTFEDRADIGDGWFHGPPVNDEVFTSAGAAADIALVHDGFALTTFRIRVVLHVPECFRHDRQVMRRSDRLAPLAITSWVTLRAGTPRVEVRTEVDNSVRDHRLRVLLPTHLPVRTYFADSPFDVIERPVALRPDWYRIREPEVETKPQYSFTAVNDGRRGLAVVSTGQPESAVRDLPERPIALTLFRGFAKTVGMEREEGGQMLGRTRHVYWICPHAGPLPAADLLRLGQQLAAGLTCVTTRPPRLKLPLGRPVLPASGSWLTVERGPLVITACKRSEDGAALIVRMFNPTARRARQRLEFAWPVAAAHQADLLEQPGAAVPCRGRSVTAVARPRQIVTLRVELRPPEPAAAEAAGRPARGRAAARGRRAKGSRHA